MCQLLLEEAASAAAGVATFLEILTHRRAHAHPLHVPPLDEKVAEASTHR